jgi:hypothetical protein
MADLPTRPTRPSGQPPPLPSRPLVPEPFVDLTVDPPPDTVRTRRDESIPPAPSLQELLQLVAGLLEVHRQELVYSRARMPTLLDLGAVEVDASAPGTGSLPPASLRTVTKRRVAKLLGKWGALTFLIPVVGAAVAKRWPAYAELVDVVTGWLP